MRSHILTLRLLIIAMFYCLITNCATVVSDPYQDLSINSSPSEADIYINGIYRGKTPSTLQVKKKKSELDIVIKKDGYESEGTIVDDKIMNPWILGNILFGGFGLVGAFIDYSSGSLTKFNRRRINFSLEPEIQQISQKNANNNENKADKIPFKQQYAANENSRFEPSYFEVKGSGNGKNKDSVKPQYQLITKIGPRVGLIVFNDDMHEFINDSIANDEKLDSHLDDRSKTVAQVVSLFGMSYEQEAIFEGFSHRLFYGLLPFVGGFDQGFYMLGADMLGGIRLNNGLEVSLGPSFTMIDRSINLGIGYNLDYGSVQVPFKMTANQTPRGARFSFSTGVSW